MKESQSFWPEWTLEEVLAQTSDSVLWRASRVEFGETLYCAVKRSLAPAEGPEQREEIRQKLQNWAREIENLRGTGNLLLPQQYALEELPEGFAVHARMELATRLSAYAAAHSLSPEELLLMGIDICTALDALARRGTVHGEVCLEHIFVSRRGGFALGGFGVGRVLRPASAGVSRTGTPGPAQARYMAPEVYHGAAPSASSDLYALGMALYRTLNQSRAPFAPAAPAAVSQAEEQKALERRMAGEALPPPRDGDPELAAILARACAPAPVDRYENAPAFRRALQQYMKTHTQGFYNGMSAAGAMNAPAPDTAPPTREPGVPAGFDVAAFDAAAAAKAGHAAPAPASAAAAAAAVAEAPAPLPPQTPPAAPARGRRRALLALGAAACLLVGAVGMVAALGMLPNSQNGPPGVTSAAAATTSAAEVTTAPPTTTTSAATTTTTAAATTEAATTATTEATTEATTAAPAVEYYTDSLISVETTLDPGNKNRTTNVRLACEFVDGTVLQPGDEFSFNKVVGKRTEDRGFRTALVYTAGEIVDGIGGGICQVSSTLYMAAIRADLEISQRRNHRYTVPYAKLGEDATVTYGSVDFRFVNNTDFPIRIDCVLDGSKVQVTFWGTKTENKRVEIVTKTLSSDPFVTVEIEDSTLAPGQRVVKNSSGHSGYRTETYRVVYIDDKEVSRTLENRSTYTRLDKSYRVGPAAATTASSTGGSTETGQPPPWLDTTTATDATQPPQTTPPETAPPETQAPPATTTTVGLPWG